MTPTLHTASEDTPLGEVVQLMEKRHIKRIPVLRGNELVGIITRANLLHALASLARDMPPAAKDDGEIRDRVVAELEKQPWKPLGLSVVVRHGHVDVSGVITDQREREAVKVAVENVPGVAVAHDHLAWVEPMSGIAVESPEDQAGGAAPR